MKKIMPVLALATVMLNACAPVYKCGEPAPEKKLMGGKRLKQVVEERNTLCANLSAKAAENQKLKTHIDSLDMDKASLTVKNAELEKSGADLRAKYADLTNRNLSQAEQFDKTLKAKSEELNNKEKLLTDRERALKEMRQKIARQDSLTSRLNDIIRNALLGFNSDELSVEIKNGKVYVSMSDKLLFKSGSASVESKGKDALKLLAGVLDKNPDIDILVEGHTDNVPMKGSGDIKDNWDLSVVRATSIVKFLTQDYKIAPTRVTAAGRGEYFPKASNETAEGKAKNRRTEIILSPKLDEIMKLLKQD